MTQTNTNVGWKLYYTFAEHFDTPAGQSMEYVAICSALHRSTARHSRIQETLCNGPTNDNWSEAWQTAVEQLDANCEKRIRELCARLIDCQGKAIEPIFSGDPRGCTVKLKLPSGFTNDWGREGVCVE